MVNGSLEQHQTRMNGLLQRMELQLRAAKGTAPTRRLPRCRAGALGSSGRSLRKPSAQGLDGFPER
jgi:hypothetical protein